MCGINLQVWKDASCAVCSKVFVDKNLNANLRNRGPDSYRAIEPSTRDFYPEYYKVRLQASVLKMRKELVSQPVSLTENCYLCWNGEIYETAGNDEQVWNYETSDTLLLAKRLKDSSFDRNEDEACKEISKVMATLYNAEFGFLILTKSSVYYGRDKWGRRSLLRWDCPNACGSFQIVSAAEEFQDLEKLEENEIDHTWTEILPGIVHQMTLANIHQESTQQIPYPSFSPLSVHSTTFTKNFERIPQGVSKELWEASIQLEYHLRRAVQMRLDSERPSAVLFSGGLDSAVVAALAAELCSHPLLLYNVSFGPSFEKSADRKAAIVTAEALQAIHSEKNILFEDIVVNWEDICQHEPHIRTLLQPKTTLMDVNIGIALWFASRGGTAVEEAQTPRVLLLGMGADEQMGGYGRHRKAYERAGWKGLQEELDMDQSRFWERNLGRDDRICSDHGKEARFPFLDAHVVRCLNEIPLSQICDFSLPPGQGDKRILRLIASRLGLEHASGLVKRAIQFGSRISHLSDAKRFGSRRKAKGEASVKKTS